MSLSRVHKYSGRSESLCTFHLITKQWSHGYQHGRQWECRVLAPKLVPGRAIKLKLQARRGALRTPLLWPPPTLRVLNLASLVLGGGLCYRPLWWSPDPTTQQVTRGRDAVGVFLVIPTYPTSSLSGNLALPQSCHSITAPHSFPAAWGPNPHI